MYAHDKVGARTAEPSKAVTDEDEREYLYERASQYGEESIKIVRLQKTADPLVRTTDGKRGMGDGKKRSINPSLHNKSHLPVDRWLSATWVVG